MTRTTLPRSLKWWFAILLVGLWSSAMFEVGLELFIERLGVSLFVMIGGVFLASACLLFGLLGRVPGRPFFAHIRFLLAIYACYWLVSWLGLFYSPAATAAMIEIIQYAWYSVLAFLTVAVLCHFSWRERRRLFCLVGITALVMLASFSALLSSKGVVTVSIFSDPNVFLLSLILAVLTTFLGVRDEYSGTSFTSLIVYEAMMVCVIFAGVLTGSRRSVALYGPIASLVPILILWLRSRQRMLKGVVFVLLGLLVAVVFISGDWNADLGPVRDTVENASGVILEDVLGAHSLAGRISAQGRMSRAFEAFGVAVDSRRQYWVVSLDILGQYSAAELLMGRGTRSFRQESSLAMLAPKAVYPRPHNFILSALLEGGLVKLGILAAFLVVWAYETWRMARRSNFWIANFVLAANLLWFVGTFISYKEFFGSKQFLLIFIVYAAFWGQKTKIGPARHASCEPPGTSRRISPTPSRPERKAGTDWSGEEVGSATGRNRIPRLYRRHGIHEQESIHACWQPCTE